MHLIQQIMRLHYLFILSFTFFTTLLNAQNRTGKIEGTITTTDGAPVPEVNIHLKELKKYTRTNHDGHFSFSDIPFGKYTIVYSFEGASPQEANVTVPPEAEATTWYRLPLNTRELQEVIVTYKKGMNKGSTQISKSGIAIMDMPQSVSVIGRPVIENQQAQKLSDVIKNVNGVYLGSYRAGTQENFYARGYNFSGTNMFKNGFRINPGSMPEMSGLESVEILKGSAAILYGNVAPGGIINMVTKKPKSEWGGEINMRAGSFDLYKPAIDVYGPLSKAVSFRVNGTYEKANSFRDVVKSTKYYVNPSFLFAISPRTELLLQGDYLNHSFTPDFGIGTLADTIIANLPRSRFLGAPWQYAKTEQGTASAVLNHKFNEAWQLHAGLDVQDFKRDYFALERIQAKANGDWGRPIGKTNNHEKYTTGEVNLTGKFNTGAFRHQVLAGTDADRYYTTLLTSDMERKIYDSINILDPGKFTPRTDVPNAKWATRTETPVTRVGIYVQDLVNLSEKFKLLAGLRWSWLETSPVKTTYLLKNDSVGLAKAITDQAFSPRLGLVYQPTKFTSVFASYSNSFTPNSGTDIYFNPLPPSVIDQYELGIKNDFFNSRLDVNLTLYRILNNNLVQMAPFGSDGRPNSNGSIKELTGQTTSDGLELDFSARPIKGMEILAGYSYNYIRYTRAEKGAGSYVKGQRLVNTPAHTANASVFYRFEEGGLKGLKLGAGAYYTGERMSGWNYTVNAKRPYYSVKPYTTVDVSAGYEIGKVGLLAKLANLTDTYNYAVHENYSINPIPPRNFVITASFKF